LYKRLTAIVREKENLLTTDRQLLLVIFRPSQKIDELRDDQCEGPDLNRRTTAGRDLESLAFGPWIARFDQA
jgi:hypothetical protein